MKRKNIRIESINVCCKAGNNLGQAVPDAIQLALQEEVDVILEFNEVKIEINRQKLLDYYYNKFHNELENNNHIQKE